MATISYASFRDLNDPSKKAETDRDNPKNITKWWLSAPGEELANSVFAQVQALIQADRVRLEEYDRNSRLYEGSNNRAVGAGYISKSVNANAWQRRDRIAFNVIQSCTDTLTAKMAKNKPKPYFLTSKGDSKKQKEAKDLNKYQDGVFYENRAYSMMPISFRDGAVWGEGPIHVGNYHGRVKWTRALPKELFADYLECYNGPEAAKTLHWVKSIDRTTLQEMLPKEKLAIEHLEGTSQMVSGSESVSDTVTIIESWRLPSAPDAKDGVHCITVPGIMLFREVWKHDFFPFAIFRYSRRLHGFWGQGLAEQLTPIQTELNRCLMTVQRSFHLGGSFKILRHVTSKIIKSHLDNQIGTIVDWAGDHPPQYIVPPMVQPEIYQQIQTLKQMAYEQSGLSQLSASGQKPAGLNSGEAQRVYHDIETDRFQTVGQAYEEFALDLAKLSAAVGRDIVAEETSLPVTVPGKRFIESIDLAKINLEDDEYVMQCYPVSKLPTDPAGRLEHIQELMQAGLIDPEAGRRLLDYPDLDEEENLANAMLDYIHQVLDGIVEDGEPGIPDPHFPPMTQLKLAIEYYAVGCRDNLEPERLEMLRTYIKQVNLLQQAAMPPAPPTTGTPQANPMPPPISNMIPNVPGQTAA